MAYYTELVADHSLTETEMATSGTKSFIQVAKRNDCTVDTLPELNDPYDAEHPACKMYSITEAPYYQNHASKDKDKNIFKHVAQYSTEPNPDFVDDNDFLNTFTGGGKIESISFKNNSKGSWLWLKKASDGVGAATETISDQSIYRRTTAGSFSKTVTIPETENQKAYPGRLDWNTYLTGGGTTETGLFNSVNKINATEYLGIFKIGQVLFSTFSTKRTTDKNGLVIQLVTLNFDYLVLDVGGVKNVEHSWQYILNDKAQVSDNDNVYQLPVQKIDPAPLKNIPNDVYSYNYNDFTITLNPTP